MRTALNVYRSCPENIFRRDQPKVLVSIIDELLSCIVQVSENENLRIDRESAKEILKKSYVISMDWGYGDTLENSMKMILHSCDYISSTILWDKIVLDCISYSKSRVSIVRSKIVKCYEKFKLISQKPQLNGQNELLKIEFGEYDLSVGKEIVFCQIPENDQLPRGYAVIEFYRFDENGNERILFTKDKCILSNGLELELINRSATFEGLQRIITSKPTPIENDSIALIPIKGDENYEESLYAIKHKEMLKEKLLNLESPLTCVHCDKNIFSSSAQLIEQGKFDDLIVGLCHLECLAPNDRILGLVKNDFFDSHKELINFDVNGWYKAAINGGQTVLCNAKSIANKEKIIAWGGRRLKQPKGSFVVEILLENGDSEFATSRNKIDRFSKCDAEKFALQLSENFKKYKDVDPFCMSDESKGFGKKSDLISIFGGSEKLRLCNKARVRAYDKKFAARYINKHFWYAPLSYLFDVERDKPLELCDFIPFISNPFSLKNFLDNWIGEGITIPEYEIRLLLSDVEFDDFMFWIEDHDKKVIIDPILTIDESYELLSGYIIKSMENIAKIE